MIYDIDNFKRELERQNLMTEQLNEFIRNYMLFDNIKTNKVMCQEDYDCGYDAGYDDGYDKGYKNGYDEGYDEGLIANKS